MRQWSWQHIQRQADETPLSFMKRSIFHLGESKKQNVSLQVISVFKKRNRHLQALSLWAYHVFSHIKTWVEEPLCLYPCVFLYTSSHTNILKQHWNQTFEDEMCPLLSQWLTLNFNMSILTCNYVLRLKSLSSVN